MSVSDAQRLKTRQSVWYLAISLPFQSKEQILLNWFGSLSAINTLYNKASVAHKAEKPYTVWSVGSNEPPLKLTSGE